MLDAPPAIDRPQYLYLPRRDRRALVILVCVLISLPAIGLWRLVLQAQWNTVIGCVLFIGVGCASLVALLRARIRVDADGIARRGWLGWRVTPWAKILERPAPTLCVDQGPWTGASRRIRRLYRAPGWLAPEGKLALQRLLTPAGTRMHLPKAPGRFQMFLFGPRTLELDAEGLRLERDGGVQTWSWAEVRKVTVRKKRATTSAINQIRIELTDGKIFSTESPTIECECPCQCRHDYLLQLFLRSVRRPEQLLIWAELGEPTSIAEARYRCDRIQSELRTGRYLTRGYAILAAGLLCFGLATGNELSMHLAIHFFASAVVVGPLFWEFLRREREDRNMLQAWLAARCDSPP
jgi:hypothetical protein